MHNVDTSKQVGGNVLLFTFADVFLYFLTFVSAVTEILYAMNAGRCAGWT